MPDRNSVRSRVESALKEDADETWNALFSLSFAYGIAYAASGLNNNPNLEHFWYASWMLYLVRVALPSSNLVVVPQIPVWVGWVPDRPGSSSSREDDSDDDSDDGDDADVNDEQAMMDVDADADTSMESALTVHRVRNSYSEVFPDFGIVRVDSARDVEAASRDTIRYGSHRIKHARIVLICEIKKAAEPRGSHGTPEWEAIFTSLRKEARLQALRQANHAFQQRRAKELVVITAVGRTWAYCKIDSSAVNPEDIHPDPDAGPKKERPEVKWIDGPQLGTTGSDDMVLTLRNLMAGI